ncbi:putative permease [Clostridium pasteurianum DSM 525 = ATCC 6013]|uniref:Putative permease n=2 Tax=Clostridium pasteurianum TaxID=1501 RepID=A0A0H3J1Q8_CLOPA|nr:AI-2E family transporter [Clostridium pasteurianum]AJA46637.1 putative permease [Clostridium pasteurianum DSM 525 = ATCC 6013]AJA50625.1 putative permease [Clostridium pasteurianum DSM 525 = ATCC 6013]KRU13363.1 protein of unknown function UPF0118 [Clostridium pasteurianum DSM 525 = ATCC 6013]
MYIHYNLYANYTWGMGGEIDLELNRRNMQKIISIIVIAVLLYWGLQNLSTVSSFFSRTFQILTPFLLGMCMAFVLNVPMRIIEKKLFSYNLKSKKNINDKIKRPISILLTIIFILAIIILVTGIVIPELIDTISTLSTNVSNSILKLQGLYNRLMLKLPEIIPINTINNINWDEINKTALDFLKIGTTNILGLTVSIASSIFSGILNFILGLVFAIYILIQKEKLSKQFKKIMYAYLPEGKVDRILYILRLSSKIFSNFISGQCLEAVILGAMFFISMTILGLPYALIIGVLISFTALIPLVGGFIGLFVGTFLILVSDPVKALWFIILFFILQQIEGNLIYPRVVGNSVGLPAIWVLAAITLLGSTFGIVGMLVSVPVFSVIYTLLREDVYPRLKAKKISPEKLK